MDKEQMAVMVEKVFETENHEFIRMVIEKLGNVTVEDVDIIHNGYEIFMEPNSFTSEELNDIQTVFEIKEIGIYGDPDLPSDDVYLHMVVEPEE